MWAIVTRRHCISAARDGKIRQPTRDWQSANLHMIGSGTSIVYVLDDDIYVRQSIGELLQSVGYQVSTFPSVDDFLGGARLDLPGCLVVDVRLPGRSGLDLQAELKRLDINLPVIFITGYGDIPMTVSAMKAGAVDFLTKPVREQDLLDAVRIALERDRAQRSRAHAIADLKVRFQFLTSRERDVIALVAQGKLNKQVAAELGVAEITVKVYRRHAMKKLGAKSLADLVRIINAVVLRA
jgi:FixJ family two-component response regulator